MPAGKSEYESAPIDLQQDFGELLPWIWDATRPVDDTDELRAAVVRVIEDRYPQQQWQVLTAINRLIDRRNATGNVRFELFPEPTHMPERRWCRLSPYTEALARSIAQARTAVLKCIVSAVDRGGVTPCQRLPLLLVTLTLDDGYTSEALLRQLLVDAQRCRISQQAHLWLPPGETVHGECLPVGYTTARVLALFSVPAAADEVPLKADLRAIYTRALTWLRRREDARHAQAFPPTVSDYLRGLRYFAATSSIPALGYDRDRRGCSVGLPISATTRLRTGRALASVAAPEQGVDMPAPAPGATPTRGTRLARGAGQPLDHRVRRLLAQARDPNASATDRHTLASRIETAISQESKCSLYILLARWALAMVDGTVRGSHMYALGTVHTYYTGVSGLLGVHAAHAPSYLENAAAWHEFYAFVAAQADGPAPSAWESVRRFHRFLERHCQAGMVDFNLLEVEGSGNAVDNNMVTPAEYRRALGLLAGQDGQPRSRALACARMLVILGFRFGLRFDEARRVEISQIEDAAHPWFIVCANRWQSSFKGDTRRLPVEPLVPPAERDELIAWRQRRLQETGGDMTAALVGEAGQPEPILERRVREAIRVALTRATGDPTVHYHHLRHSFASWTFFKLMRPLLDDRLLAGIVAFEDAELSPSAGDELRKRLLVQAPGQEALWLIAQMLGHAATPVTRRSYLRLFDHYHLCESWSGRDMDVASLGRVLGLGRSAAYEAHRRGGATLAKRASAAWPAAANMAAATTTQAPTPLVDAVYSGSGAYAEMVAICGAAAVLEDSSAETSNLATVAEASGVPGQRLQRHAAAAARVHVRYVTRRGYARFGSQVRLPRSAAEREDLCRWINHVAERLEAPAAGTRGCITRVLATCAASLSYGRSSIRFPSAAAANAFSDRLVRAIGLPRERLLLLARPIHDEDEYGWQRRKRRLARGCCLSPEQVLCRRGAKAAPQDSGGVELSIQGPDVGQVSTNVRRGSEAFRALVHYGLVYVLGRGLGNSELADTELVD